MPGRIAVRRYPAVRPVQRLSSWIPSLSILLFCLFIWAAVQVAPYLVSLPGFPFSSCLAIGLPGAVAESDDNRPLLNMAMVGLAGVDPLYLPGVLELGLPVAVEARGTAVAQSVSGAVSGRERSLNTPGSPGNRADPSQQPVLVAIYHTHNAETYIPFQGKTKVEGENGGISLVGNEMVKVLADAGIKAVHDLTIHDYPDFATSYIKSELTAKQLAQQNTGLKTLLDVHRDAGLPAKEIVRVGNEDSARILIVVGNAERLPNPHWQENYAFAQKVANRLQEKYPGVLKGVRLKEGRYNQHVFPHAILVEAGSDKNTLNEALLAGRCFATALADVLKE